MKLEGYRCDRCGAEANRGRYESAWCSFALVPQSPRIREKPVTAAWADGDGRLAGDLCAPCSSALREWMAMPAKHPHRPHCNDPDCKLEG